MSRLKVEVPRLITLNCICHSFAIIASKACKKLPSSCESLIRVIATYISGSAKRCAILCFKIFLNIERHKILKLPDTKWLCVVRFLENGEVLKSYFTLAIVEDKVKSAQVIFEYLNDNSVKAYILFLKYVLNYFNNFNALFQSRKILIHKLFESSQQLINQLAQKFDVLDDISILDLDDKNNIQHIDNIYVGPECESLLKTLYLECMQEIKIFEFLLAFREMLKRLFHKDELL